MASARVFFSKHRKHRNGFISDEVPVVENGYDVQESDEDEVFVQDPNLEISASKPLMHPRNKGQRTKVKTRSIECRFCAVCKPIFYFIALVSVLCGIMATIVYIANRHSNQLHFASFLHGPGTSNQSGEKTHAVTGCDEVDVEDVWVVGFPKLLTESAFRLVDINQDGVLDVVLGFATGVDGYRAKDIVCDIYFQGHKPCFGGVMALEGTTGKEMWRVYTKHEIYGLNCFYDLDKDGVKDCLAAGRAGTFVAISGKGGTLLWELRDSKAVNPVMNMYTAQYVADVDNDQVADIIVVHGGDPLQEAGSPTRLSGRILVVSGKTGLVLRWLGVPDHRESYYSPQILTQRDGAQVLIFGTGGETHNGSLWRIDLTSLLKGKMERAVKLSSDTHKGFMTPLALADITQDGVPDIIVPMFNSTLLAIDGQSFSPLWSARFPSSETYSTPAVGYYNNDDVPDFLVKFAHGPGYPVYYYSETTVIDGKTGKKLIDPALRDTIGGQSSPLTISMEGSGNDVFLVWMAECKGHEGSTDEFNFVKGAKPSDNSWSDICRLRFKTEGYSRLVAVASKHPQNGIPIYNSVDRKKIEHSEWVNTSAEAYDYVMKHPELLDRFGSGSRQSSKSGLSDSAEYQGVEELSNQPQYKSSHRIGSKKGPSGGYPGRNNQPPATKDGSVWGYKQGPDDVPAHDYIKGNNNRGYNQASEFNNGYLPSNQQPVSDDGYGYPYKNSGSNGYLGTPYEAYYPSDDTSYNSRGDDIYQRNYPHSYKAAAERDTHKSLKESKNFMAKRRRGRKVTRRHVGAHDDEGLQRLISTGTLAPSSLPPSHANYNNTIDVVFATYWVFPIKTKAVLPVDQKCIADKMAEEHVALYNPESRYYQMKHDEYEEAITSECLQLSDHQLPDTGTYSRSDDDYNPFNLNMGQMTVYRLRLKLSCSATKNVTDGNTRCASVLPFNQQKWAAYMGSNGDSHWSPPVL